MLRLRVVGGPIQKTDRVQIEVSLNTTCEAFYPLIQQQISQLQLATLAEASDLLTNVNTSSIIIPSLRGVGINLHGQNFDDTNTNASSTATASKASRTKKAATAEHEAKMIKRQQNIRATSTSIEGARVVPDGDEDAEDSSYSYDDSEDHTTSNDVTPKDEKHTDPASQLASQPITQVATEAPVSRVSSMFDFPVTPHFYDICLIEMMPTGKATMTTILRLSASPKMVKFTSPAIGLCLKQKYRPMMPQDRTAVPRVVASANPTFSQVASTSKATREGVMALTTLDRLCIAFGVVPADFPNVHRLQQLALKLKGREELLVAAAMQNFAIKSDIPQDAVRRELAANARRHASVVTYAQRQYIAPQVAVPKENFAVAIAPDMGEHGRQVCRDFCREVLQQYFSNPSGKDEVCTSAAAPLILTSGKPSTKKQAHAGRCVHPLFTKSSCYVSAANPLLRLPDCMYERGFIAAVLRFSMSRKFTRLSFSFNEFSHRRRLEMQYAVLCEQATRMQIVEFVKIAYQKIDFAYLEFHHELHFMYIVRRERARWMMLIRMQKKDLRAITGQDSSDSEVDTPTARLSKASEPLQEQALHMVATDSAADFLAQPSEEYDTSSKHADPYNLPSPRLVSPSAMQPRSFPHTRTPEPERGNDQDTHPTEGLQEAAHGGARPTSIGLNSGMGISGAFIDCCDDVHVEDTVPFRLAQLESVIQQQHTIIMRLLQDVKGLKNAASANGGNADGVDNSLSASAVVAPENRSVADLVKFYESLTA